MIKHNIIYCRWLLLVIITLTACKDDYLEFDYTDGAIRVESEIWKSDRHARGFLNNAYLGVPNRYSLDGNGALLASASDEAVNSNLNSSINVFNNGTWGSLRTFDDQYYNMYNYLRRTNLFLENAPTSAITPASDVPALMGEAYFLRALYHFELMKRYGAIILATQSFKLKEELDLPRNSLDEVVAQIVADCDEAAAVLTVSISDQSAGDKGRATQTAALALKARTLLYAASPLNNPSGDVAKWQKAVDAAKDVMDLGKHSLLTAAQPNVWTQLPNVWNYSTTAYNTEVIFASAADNVNTIELNNAPISYDGARGRTNPTQELVDAFEMRSTGKPITDPTSGYNSQNPYTDRDPRLGLFIILNDVSFKGKKVETFVGGKDNIPTNVNSTKTGYYLRKFLSESAAWGTGTQTNVRRPWVLFRYAEVLLNYAEALNEAQGPEPAVYASVNQVRARAGMPPLPAGLNQAQMRDRIHNERRVELCFEEHRFYDVRRWKKGEQFFNQPVSGMRITKTGNSFKYEPFPVENRFFSDNMYRFPIPQFELNNASKNLQQNSGW